MHFSTLIPDWNSLDSVRRAHSDLEAAALVFFALLVFFDILAHLSTDDKKKRLLEKIGLYCFAIAVLAEVVAYPYGERNDKLSANMIGLLGEKAGQADKDATQAITDSGIAEKQSAQATTDAGRAIKDSAAAVKESVKADNTASSALRNSGETQNKVAATESQLKDQSSRLEQQRVKFTALAEALAPRELWIIRYKDKTSSIDKLKTLSGTKIFVESIPDFEAELAAVQIASALGEAGLHAILRRPSRPDLIQTGVTVERYIPASGDTAEWFFGWIGRVQTVQAFLLQNKWDAGIGTTDEVEPNSILVSVGFKPNPFFQDPETQEWEKRSNDTIIKEFGFDATGKEEAARYKMEAGQAVSYRTKH
jgi:hypothetical protein